MHVDVIEARLLERRDRLAMPVGVRSANHSVGDLLAVERGGRLPEVTWQRQLLAEVALQPSVRPDLSRGPDRVLLRLGPADGQLAVARLPVATRALEVLDELGIRCGRDQGVADPSG